MARGKYNRVLLKLNGEALAGEAGWGIDVPTVESIAAQIRRVHELEVQVAIVTGAGNIWRGLNGLERGMDRATADYMGMVATVINALALQDALERSGVITRTQTAIEMRAVAEPYIRRRAVRHLERGRVVLFAAGTGNPYFSTDTAAALRAAEIHAEVVLMAKQGVDGVYDADPRKHSGAKLYQELSFDEAIRRNLRVMDQTALALCRENRLPVIVFDMSTPGNIRRVAMGEPVGTRVGE